LDITTSDSWSRSNNIASEVSSQIQQVSNRVLLGHYVQDFGFIPKSRTMQDLIGPYPENLGISLYPIISGVRILIAWNQDEEVEYHRVPSNLDSAID
jgi:hypothetical protein